MREASVLPNALVDQHMGLAFDQILDAVVTIRRADDEMVQRSKVAAPISPPATRIVIADDGALEHWTG